MVKLILVVIYSRCYNGVTMWCLQCITVGTGVAVDVTGGCYNRCYGVDCYSRVYSGL
jgi:hypothetical protein